jgi:hypothetical protein
MKYTTRKGSPLGESKPEGSWKKTRIENATRDVARMYQATCHRKEKKLWKIGRRSLSLSGKERRKTR